VCNAIPQALRNLSKNAFKRKLKPILFRILGSQDSYIDLSEIVQHVKSWQLMLLLICPQTIFSLTVAVPLTFEN